LCDKENFNYPCGRLSYFLNFYVEGQNENVVFSPDFIYLKPNKGKCFVSFT